MKVFIETSPLNNAHAIRGIGVYTKYIVEGLHELQHDNFQLVNNRDNADLIHYPFFDLFWPSLPLFKRGKKTVVTIHDVIPLLFPKAYPKGLKGSINLFRQKLSLQNVNAVVTDSKASQKDIHKHLGVPQEKIEVIYLAGNPQIQITSEKANQAVRKKFNLPSDFILYVGDINFNKNLPELIRAVKFLPEKLSLVLVGKNFYPQPIPEWEAIETAIEPNKERVVLLPDVGKEHSDELSALYSMASVYVQPSLAEGFGLPVLEAMQAKTLVVCTKESSLIEIGGNAVEFVSTNAQSIAQGIQNVLNLSSVEKKSRVEKAWQWSQTFTWQKTAQQTLELYQRIMSQS